MKTESTQIEVEFTSLLEIVDFLVGVLADYGNCHVAFTGFVCESKVGELKFTTERERACAIGFAKKLTGQILVGTDEKGIPTKQLFLPLIMATRYVDEAEQGELGGTEQGCSPNKQDS